MANAVTLDVATAPIDSASRGILQKLLAKGWKDADVLYETEQSILSEAEARHLLTQCAITCPNLSIRPALKSFTTPKFGPQAGTRICFTLNFNLS